MIKIKGLEVYPSDAEIIEGVEVRIMIDVLTDSLFDYWTMKVAEVYSNTSGYRDKLVTSFKWYHRGFNGSALIVQGSKKLEDFINGYCNLDGVTLTVTPIKIVVLPFNEYDENKTLIVE